MRSVLTSWWYVTQHSISTFSKPSLLTPPCGRGRVNQLLHRLIREHFIIDYCGDGGIPSTIGTKRNRMYR